MIRKLLTMGSVVLTSLMSAQTEEQVVTTTTTTITTVTTPISSVRKNDILINPFILLAGSFDASYEHHINQDMAIGGSVFFGKGRYLGNEKTWYILPYYRYYMGNKWVNGFFVEGFAGVIGQEVPSYNEIIGYYHTEMEKETNFGLGFGLGGKWQTKRNLIFEVSAGLGRAFGADKGEDIFGKGMLGIGYRF